MGSCVEREKMMANVSKPRNNGNRAQRSAGVGIEIIPGELSTVVFNHSPLQNCKILADKFAKVDKNSGPEQAFITFMILGVEINEADNLVTINFINQNDIKIYFILGGNEGITITGLTADICDVKYVQCVRREKPTQKNGDSIVLVPARIQQENIMIVMEPNLKNEQSMYLIYRYVYDQKGKKYIKKSQSIQWSSLAFNLQEIYGAQNEFKCDSGEQCSVCLSNPANVILTPCRHMCICNECSKCYEKSSKRCPICRCEFRAFIQYKQHKQG